MSERTPGGGDEAMDLDILARDGLLLDALGHGEPAPAGDSVAALLAAWHADLADDLPAPPELRQAVPDADPAAPGAGQPTAAGSAPLPAPEADRDVEAPIPLRARAARRHRPWAVRLAAAGVALLALAAGLGVSSRSAGPGSPLWSLTRVLYPQQAEVRDVEDLITRARAALDAGRPDEAGQLVAQARRELADITDPATAARLRAELDALTRDLAAAGPAPVPSAAPASPAPATRPSTPATRPTSAGEAPAPRPSGAATSPAPGSSPGSPGPLLPLPSLPLPSLSPLPGLPLPTGGLLD
ncbi:hypothetical protein ONA70_18105 [Micromonospora yasonensis]|uniref:hypothetical protein n=1 Tax=Micromonospora yasonensis TaxID=1128667 RepID=UPI00222EADDE|nr:hypothetical protein [Micromonospora yasonensis]MCW3842016.1 hypothetical protein [Micromonospora yasonensis]